MIDTAMNYRFIKNIGLICIAVLIVSCTGERQESTPQDSTENVSVVNDTLSSQTDFITYGAEAAEGAVVYIPVYSHIYQQNAQRTFNLTATLSIRNTDLSSSITICKVYYYDSEGNIVKKFLEEPREIKPLSSISHVVEENDLRGGVGANFLVLWEADETVTQPVIEAVMISTAQNQGISFVSEGRIVHERDDD